MLKKIKNELKVKWKSSSTYEEGSIVKEAIFKLIDDLFGWRGIHEGTHKSQDVMIRGLEKRIKRLEKQIRTLEIQGERK